MIHKYHYSLNWMGPVNQKFIDVNGSQWAAGRIDISADEDNPYGYEIAVPLIHYKDWERLGDWLNTLSSNDPILSLDDILEIYYDEGNPRIVFFKKEKSNG